MKPPLLIDLDGVLRLDKQIAPFAKELFEFLKSANVNSCILSNSTLSTSADVLSFFKQNGINLEIPVMTASEAAAVYCRMRYKKVSVLCAENVKSIFENMIDDQNSEAVVIGDYGKNWDFKTLNEIFKKVLAGADLIAMQKNRYWKTAEDGLLLDAGPFVAAIEYATNKNAVVIGKPSPLYFHLALHLLGYKPDQKFVMIGDDLEADIRGASELGATTILVYTGKTEYPLTYDSKIKPTYEARNLKDAIVILEKIFADKF